MSRTSSENRVSWPGSTQLFPVPAVLVGTGGHSFRNNLITVAWTGILCSDPPMLSISVRPERFSYEALRATGEFTVNIPTARLAPAVDWCGVNSGRDHDKFSERHLTALTGECVEAPLVGECPVGLECRVRQVLELGSHHAFLAEILRISVRSDALTPEGKLDLDKPGFLAWAHGHYYTLGRCLGHFGFSVRKKRSR